MEFLYYENKLSPSKREVYRALVRGLSSYERSFSAPRIPSGEYGDILSMVKKDHPLIFGVESLSYRFYDGSSNVTVTPEYKMKKAEYETTLETVRKRVKKILAPAAGRDPYETELFIHDWIVKCVRYDRLTKSYAHEVTGPLCHGIGVCEGMAKTFKLLCDEAGIDTIVVSGVGVPPDLATGKKSERHAWNVVFFGEDAYGVDVTFDNTLSKDGIRYDYFNVPDRIMSRDHGNVDFPVPACVRGDLDYYSKRGLSFEDASSLGKALRPAQRSPHSVTFRLENMPGEGLLGDAIAEAVKSDGRFSRFSSFSYGSNPNSGVVTVTFSPRDERG